MNILTKKIIRKNLTLSIHELINKNIIKLFNKSNITNIKKLINQIKNFEFDSIYSLNMMRLIVQQRKNIKNKQKYKK